MEEKIENIEQFVQNDFYVGQIFDNEYPTEVALWCNNNRNCHIELFSVDDTLKRFQIVENTKSTLEEEQQRISMSYLTGTDVERAIYKAKGMDFDDIISEVETLKQVKGDSFNIDIKALKIELKANNFYRGNPYVDSVGALLGFTKEQLDEFFKTGDYKVLVEG